MYPKIQMRDIEVLLSIYMYRYLSGSQIKRLHFPSDQTAWRRIKVLLELGLIKAFTVPNIPERIFYLDKKGADIVAIELHEDIQDLEWHRHTRQPKDYYFLKHFIAINDFRILITKACEASDIKLVGFIPEYVGEQTKEGFVKKYIRDRIADLAFSAVSYSHTPDAVFCLRKEDKAALFFLEIDRGLEVVNDPSKGFLKCAVFYLHYLIDKGYMRYEQDFGSVFSSIHTLIVTTSQPRLQHMREAVTAYPFPKDSVKRLLWGTLNSWLRIDTMFNPIWQSMDTNDTTAYQIG